MRKRRLQFGGVYLDKRYGIWYYRRSVNGKRQLQPIGKLADYPTKAKAKLAALTLIANKNKPKGITFETAARAYMAGKRWPKHPPTAQGYRNYLENYCIRRWGGVELSEIIGKPLDIETWLDDLERAGKTKSHIKCVMRLVFDFAMANGVFPVSRNPLEVVRVEGATKRSKPKRILTYDEWQRFIDNVTTEPQRTAIITAMCLGIRREEVWGKWSDFNFVTGTVNIQRTIIESRVYERTKTEASACLCPDNSIPAN